MTATQLIDLLTVRLVRDQLGWNNTGTHTEIRRIQPLMEGAR
jgi:hypothetical protein